MIILSNNIAKHPKHCFLVHDADCEAGKWGPPDCSGVCDKCYNGGICDDQSGKCICPPGFKGDHCLTGRSDDEDYYCTPISVVLLMLIGLGKQ